VEYARVDVLFKNPLHPYTRGLFQAIPGLRDVKHRLTTVEEVVDSMSEFRKLPGYEKGLVPWWPFMPKEHRPGTVRGRPEYALHEIEPGRWVGVWRTEFVEGHTSRRPSLDERRPASTHFPVGAGA
jgi:peptide/nickel transport system ATP-binding protein